MKILIVTGPPYSGKGTQCEILGKTLGYTHISTGDRLRHERENQTPLGLIMAQYEKQGDLLPDSVMRDLFAAIIDENNTGKGIILDGYPRTKPQVDDLLQLVEEKGQEISLVININVPGEELLIRALERAKNSDREDDKDPATHLKRV